MRSGARGRVQEALELHDRSREVPRLHPVLPRLPAGAITGKVKEPHVIDTKKCIKCGACMEKCKFGAISKK